MLKHINPTTPSLRNTKMLKKINLNEKVLVKTQLKSLKKSTGKNNLGNIIVYHKGGGCKKRYRKIDYIRKQLFGIVTSLEYDPYRTAYIASVFDSVTKSYTYILAPKNLSVGDKIESGDQANPKLGNLLSLNKLPLGTYIHNISLHKNTSGKLIRSAGCFGQLIQKYNKYARVKLNSGEQRLILLNCNAVIGTVSNENHHLKSIGKAGRNRWLNKRPRVRGVAMNPVDHPHGGGEGKTSGGRSSVTPWGKPSKGGATRKKNSRPLIRFKVFI